MLSPAQQLAEQKALAAEEGKDQVLQQVRLASMALAQGEQDLANNTLTQAVLKMQDFRAEGQFRATVGVESAKEWKGEPYEKMMAFLYLAQVRYAEGDYGNALAMTKSAILADTGTSKDRYRGDFVPAYVMQALCFQALGEDRNAERSLQTAIDVMWARELTEELSDILGEVERPRADDQRGVQAAKVLLLAGLPAALTVHPRDPQQAVEGARSWATDARMAALDSSRKDWPEGLQGLNKGDLRRAFDHLEPLTVKWSKRLDQLTDIEADLAARESVYQGLLRRPGLILWVETGWGPRKVADGRYGEILRIVRSDRGNRPYVTLDGQPVTAHELDSVTWQAQTRGGRRVDGFLRGKAVFKDSAGILGIALLQAGDIAQYAEDDTLAAILYIAGAVVYVGGILVNPRADTRSWDTLPDALWMVRVDPPPGTHDLQIDGQRYTVEIPDRGTVSQIIPFLRPRGPRTFGTPCKTCEDPLALPDGGIR